MQINRVSCTNRPVRVTDSLQWAHVQFCSAPWDSYSPGSVQVSQLLQSNSRVITRQEDHAHFPSVLPNSRVIILILLDADIQLRLCPQMTTRNTKSVQLITPTLHALKCERNRHTISYMFRHLLSAIIMESLYRLKLYLSNWSAVWGTVIG